VIWLLVMWLRLRLIWFLLGHVGPAEACRTAWYCWPAESLGQVEWKINLENRRAWERLNLKGEARV